MTNPADSVERRSCGGCGQSVAAHVVFCPRCGRRLKESPASRMAGEREAPAPSPPAPETFAAPRAKPPALPASAARPADVSSRTASAPVPVLPYRGRPDPAPPPPKAKEQGSVPPWLGVIVLIVLGVKFLVSPQASTTPRPVTTPPPAMRNNRVVLPPNVNNGPWNVPGPRYPSGGYGPTADDVNPPHRLPGSPYAVDRRGRLVDAESGQPVNPNHSPGPVHPTAPGPAGLPD